MYLSGFYASKFLNGLSAILHPNHSGIGLNYFNKLYHLESYLSCLVLATIISISIIRSHVYNADTNMNDFLKNVIVFGILQTICCYMETFPDVTQQKRQCLTILIFT